MYFPIFGFLKLEKNMKINGITLRTLLLIVGSIVLMANRGGSPGGRTGSSTDGGTCATNGGCHGPKTPSTQEMISTSIPASGYIPGETYTFTLMATKSGIQVWGFEMMCEDSNGDGIGAFIGNDSVTANGFRATHKFNGSNSSNSIQWKVDWVAPAAGNGDIDIYSAVLATNNSQTNGGDNVIIDTLTISENLSASVTKLNDLHLKIYPNPTNNVVTILGEVSNNAQIEIYNYEMKEVLSIPFARTIDVSSFSSGMYVLRIRDEEGVCIQKLVKQ